MMPKPRKTILLCLALILSVAALYGQFLHNPVVFDDLYFFMEDGGGKHPVSTYRFSIFQPRSLPYATLAWTNGWFGIDLMPFRLGNLLLHAALALALFGFLSTLFAALQGDNQRELGLSTQSTAFFAALLFALHPVATYAAGYLVQRTIVMAAMFSILAMWAYVKGSVREKPILLWLSVPLYYLAVFSKEHAIMLVFVFIGLTVLLHANWLAKLKARVGLFAALFAIAAWVLSARLKIIGAVYEINAPQMLQQTDASLSYLLSVLTQSWLFFKYIFLWLLPNPAWMSVDMREPFAQSVGSVYLLAAMGFVAWGAGALYLLFQRGRLGLLGFGMLFPWLMFFTEFSSVRIQVFVLYRSYLWAVGAACVLPVIIRPLQARLASMILLILAVAALAASMDRLLTFSHPITLWSDAVKLIDGRTNVQGAARIYYNRGTYFIRNGFAEEAIDDFKKAIASEPNFAEAHGNLGAVYLNNAQWTNAITGFTDAINIAKSKGDQPAPVYIYGRAQALENMGNMQEALIDYQESCRLIQLGCKKIVLR
jgi:protein O-mannosyl-transferase